MVVGNPLDRHRHHHALVQRVVRLTSEHSENLIGVEEDILLSQFLIRLLQFGPDRLQSRPLALVEIPLQLFGIFLQDQIVHSILTFFPEEFPYNGSRSVLICLRLDVLLVQLQGVGCHLAGNVVVFRVNTGVVQRVRIGVRIFVVDVQETGAVVPHLDTHSWILCVDSQKLNAVVHQASIHVHDLEQVGRFARTKATDVGKKVGRGRVGNRLVEVHAHQVHHVHQRGLQLLGQHFLGDQLLARLEMD